jgi:DNA-binding MarR family transcriptional regulator
MSPSYPDEIFRSKVRADPKLRVSELIDRVGRVTRGLQFVNGLSPAQWEALRYTSRANRYSTSPTALAKFLGTTKGTISQTLISLEKKGYLQRLRDERDRRSIRLEVTPAGWRLLERDPLLEIDKAVACLPAHEKEALFDGLSRMLRDVQRKLGGNEFGVCEECSLFSAENTPGAPDNAYRCGLTSEAISDDETQRICINFKSPDKRA